MEKILFRGKSKLVSINKWFYGSYVHDEEWAKHYIYQDELVGAFHKLVSHEVNPETVGQFVNKLDKNEEKIFVGHTLKIRVVRENYETDKNIHHGVYYVKAVVLDVRGNLKYDKKEIEAIEARKERELFDQCVRYDTNLFQPGWCREHRRDKKGKWIRYTKEEDSNQNIKTFYDYEVIE